MIEFILIVIFLALWAGKKIKTESVDPPILTGSLPVIGHLYMLRGNSTHLWKVIKRWSIETLEAGGVTRLQMGPQSYYVVADPEDSLTIANNCINKHYAYNFGKRWLGNGLITASGSTWKEHRKLLSPAFAHKVLIGFMEIFNGQSRKLRAQLHVHAGSGAFDVSGYLIQMALENICLTAFGISAEEDAKLLQSYANSVKIILNIVTARFQNIWLHSDFVYGLSKLRAEEDKALMVINSMADVVIKKKRAAMLQTNKQTEVPEVANSKIKFKALLDLLLDLSEEEALTDREIREEIDTAIAAALDSTAWVLTYTLVLLGSHQEIQEKVYKEICEVFKENRDVDYHDLPKLVYLEAVIKESLRLYTTGPITLRTLDKDIKLKNYTIKSGSHCLLSAYGIHRHSCWGPDKDEFIPERWLKPETQGFVFAGFSLGRRTCLGFVFDGPGKFEGFAHLKVLAGLKVLAFDDLGLLLVDGIGSFDNSASFDGKTYAMMSIKVALSHLLRDYKVTANCNDLELKLEFILKPAAGHLVSIERRID